MKAFHYKGKYDGNEDSLPQREHPEGSVPFKEMDNMKTLSLVMNVVGSVIAIILIIAVGFISGENPFNMIGILAFVVTMVPHEFLHGICFKGDVYMYQNLLQGMLFVVSPDDISKGRFIFMSMLPNIVFGFIPFILFLIQVRSLYLLKRNLKNCSPFLPSHLAWALEIHPKLRKLLNICFKTTVAY